MDGRRQRYYYRATACFLILLPGCTLGTRPLTTAEQAVVTDMAADCSEYADRVTWRVREGATVNHAPAWMRPFGHTFVVLTGGHQYRPDNNTLRWIVYHEMCHVEQSWREGFWWPCEYTFNSRRYEDEANEFANLHMENRSGKKES